MGPRGHPPQAAAQQVAVSRAALSRPCPPGLRTVTGSPCQKPQRAAQSPPSLTSLDPVHRGLPRVCSGTCCFSWAPADAIFLSKPRENETRSFSRGIACLQSSRLDAVLALSCLDAVSFRVFLKKQTEAHNKGTPLPFKIDLVKQKDVPQVLLLEAFHRIYGHEKHHGSCFQSLWVFKLLEQLLGDWLRPRSGMGPQVPILMLNTTPGCLRGKQKAGIRVAS